VTIEAGAQRGASAWPAGYDVTSRSEVEEVEVRERFLAGHFLRQHTDQLGQRY